KIRKSKGIKLQSLSNNLGLGWDKEKTSAWTNDQEKEQFSPVSVLDCPFKDEEEEEDEVCSPLQQGIEGSKKKPMKRVRRFDCLNQLQPTNLQTRITVIEESSSSSSSEEPLHPYQPCTSPHNNLFSTTRKDPLELLTIVKERASSSGCSISKCDQLLFLDFFEERLLRKGYVEDEDDDPLLEEVEEWVKGGAKEMLVGWEVNESRNVYLRDMEENGGWRNYVCEVEDELGFDMGLEILGSLVDEVVLEILF
ncbi:hypothetical protein LINPERHAP2_LOCUS38032, partial [Linum perenne]